MERTVALVVTLDTKFQEAEYLRENHQLPQAKEVYEAYKSIAKSLGLSPNETP